MTGKYNRKIKRGIVMPVQQFINREKSAGVVLGISIVVAMVLANSPWSEDYFHLLKWASSSTASLTSITPCTTGLTTD